MVKVIQGKEGFGSLLGRNLGGGLQESLGALAQNKLQNMINQQKATQITPGLIALGIPNQEAQQIAMLPESLQSLVLKNYLQAAESAGLDQALQGLSGQNNPDQSDISLEALAEAPVQQPNNPFASMQEIASSLTQPKPTPEKTERGATAQQKPKAVADLLRSPRLTPEHRLKLAAIQNQRQQHTEKLSAAERKEIDAKTKDLYDSIHKGAQGAREGERRLTTMRNLIENNELNSAQFLHLLEGAKKVPVLGPLLGPIAASALTSPGTQEFEKLSNDFVKNAKDYFGGRLTDADLRTFMATVPTIWQSNEAKLRVMNNMQLGFDIAVAKEKISKDIIRENGGKRPYNYSDLVAERLEPIEKELTNRFEKGLEGLKRIAAAEPWYKKAAKFITAPVRP